MEDEMILSRATDRRIVKDDDSLPPGPPGAENDSFDIVQKKKDSKPINRDPRRRSPSRDRRSRSRSRGKRRSRSRDYSPPPRRYGNNRGRRSRDRNIRSPPERNRSRDRNTRRRDRSRSRDRYRSRRSRSRSDSPQRRWSPMPKPPSPAMPPPPQYSVPQYDTYGSYGNQYMGQFPAYDYANQVQVPYPAAYPCEAPAWPQVPPPAPSVTVQQPVPQVPTIENEEEQRQRDAAIAQEAQNQRDQLNKQRNDYLKRATALKREMKILKDQRSDLVSSTAPPSPTTKGFLEENDRLQSQIQRKLSTIENVIDMLSSIIGEDKQPAAPEHQQVKKQMKKPKSDDDDNSSSSSPERLKTKLIESMKSKRDSNKKEKGGEKSSSVSMKTEKVKEEPAPKTPTEPTKKINYSFYDPEMNWCITCDVFPKTAKDYLTHLQSEEHSKNAVTPETPWHENVVNDEFPTYQNAPTKRTPIRGLQFFVPSTGWYCKLCNFWMGDLHCASSHLKSRCHWDKYNKYTEQNPHFEVDWMADRQKVLEGLRAKENFPPPPPQITPVVSTTGMDLLESIPLQINNQKVNLDLDKKEKKKKKKEEKKEKKKKKRSKKRKKESSSSSSSSSESTSDSEKEKKAKDKEDRSNSIRVAMRKILGNDEKVIAKDDSDVLSKWRNVNKLEDATVPKVTGAISTLIASKQTIEMNKKDELISQWNTPQPIISESEKKLLEDLKGKLKTKTATESHKPPSALAVNDTKKRDRSPNAKSNHDTNKSKLKRSKSPERKSRERESVKRNKSVEKDVKDDDRRNTKNSSVDEPKEKMKDKSVGRDDQRRSKSRDRRSKSLDAARKGRGDRRSRSRGRRTSRSRSRGRRNNSRTRVVRRGRFSPDRRRRRSPSPRKRSRSPKRSRSIKRSRSPRRSRSRKRSTSRRRSRSTSPRYGRRRSTSRSRSRSRSRSYRIEKPIVRFPEFRPRVPPNEKKKSETDSERKKTPPPKKPLPAQPAGGKKLPFIGRMPVFKKQSTSGDGDKKEDENNDDSSFDPMTMGYDQYEMSMMAEYDDLMPDPMQYVTLMGAPPPPPSGPPPEDEKDMLPPGIDESEADTAPKPINDGPLPRKGPLPKDFQEALNIIFPGEKKPDSIDKTDDMNKPLSEPDVKVPLNSTTTKSPNAEEMSVDANSVQTDEASQHSGGEAFLGFPSAPVSFTDITQDVPDLASLVAAVPPPPPPPPPPPQNANDEEKSNSKSELSLKIEKETTTTATSSPPTDPRRQEELDDLAMLGIDADDLAAQCM